MTYRLNESSFIDNASCLYTGTLFYLTTHLTLYMHHFAWWQAAQCMLLLQFAVSEDPRISVCRAAECVTFLPTVFQEGAVNVFVRFTDTRHI